MHYLSTSFQNQTQLLVMNQSASEAPNNPGYRKPDAPNPDIWAGVPNEK